MRDALSVIHKGNYCTSATRWRAEYLPKAMQVRERQSAKLAYGVYMNLLTTVCGRVRPPELRTGPSTAVLASIFFSFFRV